MNITDCFLNYMDFFVKNSITDETHEQAKKCFIDYLGSVEAGAYLTRNILDAKETDQPTANNGYKVFGSNRRYNRLEATYHNAFNAHKAELDDGHRITMVHAGSPIISSLLTVAQMRKLDARKFYESITIGYQAAHVIAMLIQPNHKKLGYHSTATCGTFGAALASAYALNKGKNSLKTVLSLAATNSTGLLAIFDDDSKLKPASSGNAAMSGLHAALIGNEQLTPPVDILGGRRGFIKLFSGKDVEQDKAKQILLDFTPEITRIYFKPYAGCRHSHPAIEAALKIRGAGINLNEIKHIEIRTYSLGLEGHDHTTADSSSSALMSTPCGVSLALIFGNVGIREYNDVYIQDKMFQSLLEKTSIIADEEMSKIVPQKRPASVKIVMNDGSSYVERVELSKGEPENPMSLDDIRLKMSSLFEFSGLTNASQVLEAVQDEKFSLSDIINILP